ncbi:ATP-grasp domain-containing protein [Candidatus Acetothermia bacterium]|nr:ATP-grasp domain-containing protein [Candidatus Acetothermia bacterium]MBI3644046.1 ATP-grasp domain-containing protein [Candidatus Acetothermia bacterium]
MFKKVLVANRGEIAIRIFGTLRDLGIRSVAVYSEADRESPHVIAADEACEIGPPPAAESYLQFGKIIEAARKTKCDAIHPGYGFLSENPLFVEAVQTAGLVFIGPSADAMRQMGDKGEARQLAEHAGVPITPGASAMQNPKEIGKAARKLGLPVLLKAAAGGGGKGMRLIREAREISEAIGAAQREAQASFSDSRLIVEKFIQPARHIEVQIIADQQGNTIALGERECSLQRRHQKIIEESPSTAVSKSLRDELQRAASKLAKAVGYTSAGTIEFLLGQDDSFYFMEMNTRLQVEHPVTEAVTGVDLVRLQLEVAAGKKLPLAQKDVQLRGHAIEARLYAEDPNREFLPMTGEVLALQWPNLPGFRVDSGIMAYQKIHAHYDPMLAKLITWGPDREQARQRLIHALRETAILGLTTNRDFLIELLKSTEFSSGETYTGTLATWMSERDLSHELESEMLVAAAVAADRSFAKQAGNSISGEQDPYSPWRSLGGWRHLG